MRLHHAAPREIDTANLKFRGAGEADYSTLLSDTVDVVSESGELLVAYRVLDKFPGDLLQAFQNLNYGKSIRTDGLVTRAKTLGFLPRVTIRRDYCTCTATAQESPEAHTTFLAYAQKAAGIYADANSTRFATAMKQMAEIRSEWLIPGTPFTSGICNHNNVLRYHHDAGNFLDTWSCMYALSNDCPGGNLVIPSLDIAFSFQRPALIMFDGQSLLHGVTPLRKRNEKAYRYSVVFYGLKAMRNCLSPAEELMRIRQLRVKRERKRANLPDLDPTK